MAKKEAKEWQNRIVGYGEESPDQLLANPRNHRIHPKRQQDALSGSLETLGLIQTVIVNKATGHIVDGHLRVTMALREGQTSIPVTYVELTEAEEAQALLSLDPIAAMAANDKDKVDELLRMVNTDNEQVMKHLADFAAENKLDYGQPEKVDAPAEIDRAAELAEKWATASGQLWRLGDHRLLIGDCTVRENVKRLMGGERAELLFTSPPYADAREYGGDDLSIEKLSLFFSSFLNSANLFAVNLGILRKDNEIVCYWDKYIEAAKNEGLKFLSWNIWNRETAQSIAQQTAMFPIEHEFIFIFGKDRGELNKTIPNKHAGARVGITDRQTDGSLKRRESKLVGEFRALGTVFTSPPHKGVDIGHPAMFPISFAEAYIEACTPLGGCVIEPFCGSGTTIIAAQNLGRRCYACEISPAYGGVILERFFTATGIQPELVN